ncbi:MAG: Glu/Leu/Phe/Val dehydrogenase dimerization domain-containing protein [Maricaulaceae bacterium]
MSIFEHPDFDAHEAVHFVSDPRAGLLGIIAVHSTVLGPAAGGTRFWNYADSYEALTDALRLSRAMSLKNAMAKIPHGGGKGVLIRPSDWLDRKALFAAYGRRLNVTNGTYYTAEDVGVSPDDMEVIRSQTPYVAGLDTGEAASGDPSPVTADGVFRGLKVAIKHGLKAQKFEGLTVAVQGLGSVGYALCGHLHKAGAKLLVADINADVLTKAKAEFGAEVVAPEAIHAATADIYAPCALGGAVNPNTIGEIKAGIIGGAANNQLLTPKMGETLQEQGKLYCPDYVINGGGIINVASELSGTYDPKWVDGKLEDLAKTLDDVISQSRKTGRATHVISEEMALSRIEAQRPAISTSDR